MRDYMKLLESLHICVCNRCSDPKNSECLARKEDDCRRELMAIAANAIEKLVSTTDKFKWISVEKRLPDVNKRVLACVIVLGEPSVWDAVRWNGEEWETEKEAVYEYWTSIEFPVTHWMPLPEPPKEDKP